jgi:cation diffusion facilitator CzcD-associated flavoprotein CzcO
MHRTPEGVDSAARRGGSLPLATRSEMVERASNPKIAIMGAGPGGLCMAIRLLQSGIDDFVVLEKGSDVGGTWYHNRYPGCECDIASHLYSFSFEVKPDWSKPYARQPEILEYLKHCVAKYGLAPYIRFDSGVERARWNDATSRWKLELGNGSSIEAEIVVSAIGMFNDIEYPDIPGLDTYEGTHFHSARWNWDHDLTGRTVGVIGSAASAVQFVPEIIKDAAQVHLFQRTANWVLPKEDTPYTEEQLEHFRSHPDVVLAMRKEISDGVDGKKFLDPEFRASMEEIGLAAIAAVEDPQERRKLTPTHPWFCKRPLFANNYYSAFNEPNLELVTEPIDCITKTGVITEDGKERCVDTLVLATGFSATKYLSSIDVTGRGGLRLDDAWSDGAHAYKGIATSGFPNMFMLYGPNTNQGSIITMIEYQVEYTLKLIQHMQQQKLGWVDVKCDREARYNDWLQKEIDGVEAWHAGCNSYYRSPSGRVVTQWPQAMGDYGDQIAAVDGSDYEAAKA